MGFYFFLVPRKEKWKKKKKNKKAGAEERKNEEAHLPCTPSDYSDNGSTMKVATFSIYFRTAWLGLCCIIHIA